MDKQNQPPTNEPVCTGNCKIVGLVEISICQTCGWIDEPPAPGDAYTNNQNQQ